MDDLINSIVNSFQHFTLIDFLDIIIIAYLIYRLLLITMQTRAIQVVKGVGFILIAWRLAEFIGLSAVAWVIKYILNAGALVLVIIFQPEIRKALEHIGGTKFLGKITTASEARQSDVIADEIVRACTNMSKKKIGALIVMERRIAIGEVIESGTILKSEITSQLLESIFMPGTPLHDGAVVVRDGMLLAAGCFLPLSERLDLDKNLGTRHRAALGMSEHSDALIIVVSEETGTISVCHNSKMTRYVGAKALKDMLFEDVEEKKEDVKFYKMRRRTKK